MMLSKLNAMAIGPLWALRHQPVVDAVAGANANLTCPVCGAAWLEYTTTSPQVLIVLVDRLTDPDEQTLLDNCIKARGWSDVASCLGLHAACSAEAGLLALQHQLAATPAELVVVFGEDAAQKINPEFKRGSVQRFLGNDLVVTQHPAQMLATPALKYQTWSDLCLARLAS